jgi:pyruvate,orthophosphate dikinase
MKRIYKFSADHCDWSSDQKNAKTMLGGKGAALMMMAKDGLPVPPGFTITTDVCKEIAQFNTDMVAKNAYLAKLLPEVIQHMDWLEGQFGFRPLVSVRSGAPVSMPGMMDTILNVGLTTGNIDSWCDRLGVRAAYDSMRRLIQMLGYTAYGVPHEVFEFQLAAVKKAHGVDKDTDLDSDALVALCGRYEKAFKENKGFEFPIDDAEEQLRAAVKAVFDSWMNPRAIEYRKLNNISGDMGTAVNVQTMVFGNMGEDSGSGVLFTRDPSTGHPGVMGEYLPNAQGEDVVAGIRTPFDLHKFNDCGWYAQLMGVCEKLEESYRDMVDVEFTVMQGKLFVLQSRTGKRSARAAFRIAADLHKDGVIEHEEVFKRLTVEQFKTVRRPTIDPKFKTAPSYVGLPACPGVVTGKPVFSSEDAVDCVEPCILVTHETNPNDIAGMAKAVGILTQTGGATSHAAVVARAMDKACVVGCTELDMAALKKAKKVTIDGATGKAWVDTDVPVIDSSDAEEVGYVCRLALAHLEVGEATPVDLEEDRQQVIFAAHWWGSEEALDAVLAGIEEANDKSFITLDVTMPNQFAQESDMILANCFGEVEDGLPFLNAVVSAATNKGFAVKSGAKAYPADYAAFKVLAH